MDAERLTDAGAAPPPGECRLCMPGHVVHPLLRRKWHETRRERPAGIYVDVDDAGWITLLLPEGVRSVWNHDPDGVRRLASPGDRVDVDWVLKLLGFGGPPHEVVHIDEGVTACSRSQTDPSRR